MWQNILKRWAYGADNIDEYLEGVRRGIDYELDYAAGSKGRSFNQNFQSMKKEFDELREKNPERWNRLKESTKDDVQYRFSSEKFEEGNSHYEFLVSRFGHYAARRARMPKEILREMARTEHHLKILNYFGLEELKKFTIDMMKDWYVSGHYDEYEDA